MERAHPFGISIRFLLGEGNSQTERALLAAPNACKIFESMKRMVGLFGVTKNTLFGQRFHSWVTFVMKECSWEDEERNLCFREVKTITTLTLGADLEESSVGQQGDVVCVGW